MSSFVACAVYAAVLGGVWWNWGEEEGYHVEQGIVGNRDERPVDDK